MLSRPIAAIVDHVFLFVGIHQSCLVIVLRLLVPRSNDGIPSPRLIRHVPSVNATPLLMTLPSRVKVLVVFALRDG